MKMLSISFKWIPPIRNEQFVKSSVLNKMKFPLSLFENLWDLYGCEQQGHIIMYDKCISAEYSKYSLC